MWIERRELAPPATIWGLDSFLPIPLAFSGLQCSNMEMRRLVPFVDYSPLAQIREYHLG